jgi:4-amino-4-deoxy-L-arabinose transferase-like glycosyltransferase
MDVESQTSNLKKSWISRHPLIVIGVILVVCLGPFINKPIHGDDALYIWTAEWIQKHPANFGGFDVNEWASAIPMWKASWNPPLLSYYLAGVASVFGWHEIVLHLACLAVTFAAAAGIYFLARMWCDRPLLATLIAMLCPAFLVSSTTLMCDVPMLACWIWALVLWERALTSRKQNWWRFAAAGALAGLAVLTKYSAMTLLPLLPILAIMRTRKLGWWWVGLAASLLLVAGYEWITAQMYGRGLFSLAVSHTHHSREFPSQWLARGIIGLAFTGGCLLPLLFYAPLVWRPKTLLAAGMLVLGMWLVMFVFWNNLGVINTGMGDNPEGVRRWYFVLEVALLMAGGLQVLLLASIEAWRVRDITSVTLALWIIGGFFSATVLNFAVNARSLLLIVPPAAIVLVRRLEATRANTVHKSWLAWPLVPAAAVTLSMAISDFQVANSARTAAEQIMAKYETTDNTTWFEGHGTFQYYMGKLGGQPIDVERSLLKPGDIVVVPEVGILSPLPYGSVGWLDCWRSAPFAWINLEGATESGAAGFYGSNWGPVPFVIGKLPLCFYDVVKVSYRLRFNSRPTNPQAVQAGDVPSFKDTTAVMSDAPEIPVDPEAKAEVQLAVRAENEGKIKETIQHYRAALDINPNNPVILNNLAWILATTSRAELRDGREAVNLATRAVALSDSSMVPCIGTLAAAYAEAGQFSRAVETEKIAFSLALITGQHRLATQYVELMALYSSGKAVRVTPVP